MEYIRVFATEQERESALAQITHRTLSVVRGTKSLQVMPGVPPAHDYVEIGGIKWATMNIGAETIYDVGLYFQWGDTQGYPIEQVGRGSGQKRFSWYDYKYGTQSNLTKYNETDNKPVLDLSDDAVHAAWGGNWRMPTHTEFKNLVDSTKTQWVENYNNSGVNGMLFTDKTDNTKVLFFPETGRCYNGSRNDFASNSYVWMNTLENRYGYYYSAFYYNISRHQTSPARGTDSRCYGLTCRGTLDE